MTDILQNQLRRDSAERSEPANWRLMYASAADALAAKDAEIAALTARVAELTRDRDAAETDAARDVLAERQRQISAEGWTPEHDDAHEEGSLACAAGCYAIHAGLPDEARVPKGWAPQDWPWGAEWWKPKDRRSDLVRAGALILAEIERLDRAALKGEQP